LGFYLDRFPTHLAQPTILHHELARALHGALAGGHASPAEIDLIYGPGAADAIRSAATS
jgi:hypothetical protein